MPRGKRKHKWDVRCFTTAEVFARSLKPQNILDSHCSGSNRFASSSWQYPHSKSGVSSMTPRVEKNYALCLEHFSPSWWGQGPNGSWASWPPLLQQPLFELLPLPQRNQWWVAFLIHRYYDRANAKTVAFVLSWSARRTEGENSVWARLWVFAATSKFFLAQISSVFLLFRMMVNKAPWSLCIPSFVWPRTQSNAMLTPRPSALSHFFIASWNWQRIGRQSSSLTLPLAFKHVRASLGMCRSVRLQKAEWELAWQHLRERDESKYSI
jgi:hypothetical protein